MSGAAATGRLWSRLRRQPAAVGGLIALLLIIAAALLLPSLSPYDYYTLDWQHTNQPPGSAGWHWLGTDALGRDVAVRVLWGCRISLLIGCVASLVSVLIGVAWGATAGYAGGRTDALMMRAVDVLYSVPFIPFVIVLTVIFGRDLLLVFAAIGAVSWLDTARVVRGQTLALRQREFIEAARVGGASGPAIVWRHIVPNLLGIVAVQATLTVPTVILFEAFLGFLGLGVQAPMSSLGSLIADGAARMQSYPHLLIVPALCLAAIVLACNQLGDGLRDALDPRACA